MVRYINKSIALMKRCNYKSNYNHKKSHPLPKVKYYKIEFPNKAKIAKYE